MATPVSQATKDRLRAEMIEEVKEEVMGEIAVAATELAEEIRAEERAKFAAELRAAEATIRAELIAQVRETGLVAEKKNYSGPVPDSYEFWTLSKTHTPKLLLSDGSMLKFVEGHLIVYNQVHADAIRRNLAGQVWETDWPEGKEPPRCKVTGFSPKSFEAWMAYQEWTTPQTPSWQPLP